ncbi:MAG TPA: cupredoxin domain-containing protein [Dehalococcoidia bacterium]|nr:cupredoxin domain-containing protein [Dehalococcoidia bacterium]
MLPIGFAVALLGAAACSSSNNNAGSSNGSAANNNAAPVGTVVTTAVPRANIGSPAAGATTLTEVTTDNKYSETKLSVKAGVPVTLTVQNKGSAVHNWHLLDVKDDSGKEIKTDLDEPGKTSSVTFTIGKPGTYKFQCDVHPSDMTGTLTVQ